MARKKKQSDPRERGRRDEDRALDKRGSGRNRYVEEYDYGDDESSIDKASMKTAMRYIIIAVFFFAISLIVLFGSILLQNTLVTNRKASCWTYQQQVQQMATDYMTTNRFSSLPAYVEDIPGFEAKRCPSGGEYTWDPIDGKYTCSVHGDVPDTFNQAQTKKTGQTTTITNSNSS